jgi:hypothetical protein
MSALDQVSEWIVYAVPAVALILLSRAVWLWYFKINRIEKHLADIAAALKPPAARNAAGPRTALPRS